MSDLTTIPPNPPSSGYSVLTVELAKMLALVAPITMTSEQQELWLRAAVDSLMDIRPDELSAVSLEVRRSVTRPSQIVPEIAKLVHERRVHRAQSERTMAEEQATKALLPAKRHIMDRNRSAFKAEDWAELNQYLESMGSQVRYGPDGKKSELA